MKTPEVIDVTNKIKGDIHVDDVKTGEEYLEDVKRIKELFKKGEFELHKIHSNDKSLESSHKKNEASHDQSFAKDQFGIKENETKILVYHGTKLKTFFQLIFRHKLPK